MRAPPDISRVQSFGLDDVAAAQALARTIELSLGRDLQYIRINGTLVGGLLGLVIFTGSRLAFR